MRRNVAGQKVKLFAFDTTTGLPKLGDAANITASVSKDNGASTDLTDTSATESDATKEPGFYVWDVAQAESDGADLLFTGRSTTANVSIVAARFATIAGQDLNNVASPVGNNGKDAGVLWEGAVSGITGTQVTLPGGHNLSHEGNYAMRLMSGAGFGRSRFLEYSGSAEVWNVNPPFTANGGSAPTGTPTVQIVVAEPETTQFSALLGHNNPLDAAGTRGALGMATNNLDAQLAALVTNAQLATALAAADDATLAQIANMKTVVDNIFAAVDTEIAAIKAKTDALPNDPASAATIATSFTNLSNAVATIMTTALTESYATLGSNMTPAQLLYEVRSLLAAISVSGSVLTAKKLNGTTVAGTYALVLDGSGNPISIVRAS